MMGDYISDQKNQNNTHLVKLLNSVLFLLSIRK